MAVEFTILASGSRGNSAMVRSRGAGLLIDLGLGSRLLTRRMEGVGACWEQLAAALLTHTHGDHVCDSTLRALLTRGIPLYCHEGQRRDLARFPRFLEMERSGLIRCYDDRPFLTPDGSRVEPIAASHDSGPTYGFRVECRAIRRGPSAAIGYLSDTGCWRSHTADAMADVDVMAVEFNHDVEMQRNSGRSPHLIARNLGNKGHLSNDQAADLVSAVLDRSRPGAVKHVVLLHLSQECNHPHLAISAARAAVRASGRRSSVHAADQWTASPHLPVSVARRRSKPAAGGFPWEVASEPAGDDGIFRLEAG